MKILEEIEQSLKYLGFEFDQSSANRGIFFLRASNVLEGRWEEYLILELMNETEVVYRRRYKIDSADKSEVIWTNDRIKYDFLLVAMSVLDGPRALDLVRSKSIQRSNLEVFSNGIITTLVAFWKTDCLCNQPGFTKLMSFDYTNYGLGPVTILDKDIIGREVIQKVFVKVQDWKDSRDGSERTSIYQCPRCMAEWEVRWEQFSVNFECCTYKLHSKKEMAPRGSYLLGFGGLVKSFQATDYSRVGSVNEFFKSIGFG